MGLFKREAKPAADGYERKAVRGYVDKGKVAQMLAEGWEIENTQQVQVNGTTFKQATFLLRRRVSEAPAQ